MANELLMRLVFTGEIDVERGPLGRFQDLADQIQAEGHTVPSQILAVLAELSKPLHDLEQEQQL